MASSLRPTGISVIGDVRWGTHFCYFYETKRDLLDTLVPYFKAGLESNEFCLWVVSQPLTVEEAKRALGQAVPALDRHLAEGGLEIHGYDEWYFHNQRCDPRQVLQGWCERLNQALARGYAGMRASGDTSWIHKEDWRVFCEYEKELDALIADPRRIILCTYSLTASSGVQIFDAVRLHQMAVARRHGRWEMIETSALQQAKAEMQRLNDELEQKVEKRTRELATTNEVLKGQIIERQEAERQSRVLINAIPQQIWSGPPGGTLDYCNDRWRSYMGLNLEELQGDGWQAMLHPEDRDRVLNAWYESVLNGTPYEQEERHRRADGTYRWFLSRGVPLRDTEGRIVRWYGTNTDIEDRKQAEEERERFHTQQKRAEEALRQSQAMLARVARATTVGELTVSIAHEVNQPLGAVVINADACLRWLTGTSPNLKEAREALQRIIRDGHRASEVVARIRSLLKKGEPAKTRFSLNEMIGEIVALTEAEAQQRHVSLQIRLEPDLPPVNADRVQLQQVLLNLVMNSLDALSESTRRPRLLTIEAKRESSGAISVAVQDTGIGIDPPRMKEVFEPFYTTKPEGLGLGLSISRSIIEAHGGRLEAAPNDGPGVRFSFTLPVDSAKLP